MMRWNSWTSYPDFISILIAKPSSLVLTRGINSNTMELVEEVVIVGAGIAGLALSLGLHRYVLD
jgi:heterodisulfide reductase subunit A-like polyferredoxin